MRNFHSWLTVLTALVLCLIPSCAEPEWPEGLPHGEVILTNIEDPDSPGAYFDFSEGEIVYGDEGRARGDVYVEATFIAGNPALGIQICDEQPDSILYNSGAPSWGGNWKSAPDINTPPRIGIQKLHNIWVRTAEGNIAKMRIMLMEANDNYTSIRNIKMQWIFQPDPESNELVSTSFTKGDQAVNDPG